jgi:hypothetical protein
MSREKTTIPDDLLQLKQRLEEWRSAQPSRSRLPETFWVEAVEMARRYGLHLTAKTLRMDYMRLKKRLSPEAECSQKVPRSGPPSFLELLSPSAGLGECVVELEPASGKIRVAMKGMRLDWGGLLRAWREAAR